jgi:hypothetical protein
MNPFLRKSIATALDMSTKEVDAIMNAASAFRSNEIDREMAMRIFDKLTKKTPSELNEFLKYVEAVLL